MYKGKISATIPDAPEGKQVVSKVVEVAENFADAVKLFGSEQKVIDLLNQKYKIDVQNALRREGRVSLGLVEKKNGSAKGKGIARA